MTGSPFDRSRYFGRKEFDSPDLIGSGVNMDIEFIIRLDCLRGWMDRPFVINSGFRTSAHNRKVGGSPNSAHKLGKAADINTVDWSKADKLKLIENARRFGINGIGIGKNFIHIDTMPRIAAWRYVPSGHIKIALGDEAQWA